MASCSTSTGATSFDAGGDASNPTPDARVCPAPVLAAACNTSDGLGHPIPTCTAAAPCTLLPGVTQTAPILAPACGGVDPLQTWTDANGETRYACVYTPPDAHAAPRPLLVFFHGSHGNADNLYNATGLRTKAESYALGDGTTGFVVASVEARNLQWYGPNPPGAHFDYFYRDLATDSCNPDVRSADQLIDTLVATGTVDRHRIYVAGWSNGAFFAEMYAIGRFTTPTPGGAHVAAALGYAGADPYGDIVGNTGPSCQLASYPVSQVPIYSIHRSCDAFVPCNPAQANGTPDIDVATWIGVLTGRMQDSHTVDVIVDDNAAQVTSCDASCSLTTGALNHVRWPDGQGNDGATDWEPAMLAFLHAHPHP